MAKINQNDFIEIGYTGKLKTKGVVFDTTDKAVAEKEGISNPKMTYGSVIVCLGKGHLVSGLDAKLIGKEPGKYSFDLSPEEAFGKKDAKLIQMVPTRKFIQQGIRPVPGLQVNIDGVTGVLKTASGGRCIVDFNHPLSGKEVSYDVDVSRIVTDAKEKVVATLELQYNLKDSEVKVEGNKALITLKNDLPKNVTDAVTPKLKEITGVDIEFVSKKEEKKPKTDKPAKPEVKEAAEAKKV